MHLLKPLGWRENFNHLGKGEHRSIPGYILYLCFFFPPLDISVTWSGSFLILLQCRKHHLSELELCVGISTPSFIPIVTVLPRSWEAPLCLPPSECRVMRAVLWHTPMYEMTPSFRKPENPAQGHTVRKWEGWDLVQVTSARPHLYCPLAGVMLDPRYLLLLLQFML